MRSSVQHSKIFRAIARYRQPEPRGIPELVERMEGDYQIVLAKRALTSNAKQSSITVTADSEAGAEVAEWLQDLFWKRFASMLECVPYGRVAYEKQWGIRNGHQVVSSLNEIPFQLSQMWLDADGKFAGVHVGKGEQKTTLDRRHSWWLALDAKPLEPHGRSRYLGAPHTTWKERQETLRLREIFLRKFVLRGGVVYGPDVVTIDGESYNAHDWFAKNVDLQEAGAYWFLPNDRMTEGVDQKDAGYVWNVEDMKYEVLDGKPILDAIGTMDQEQLLAFGIPPKTLIEGDAVGSFAMVSQQMLILLSVVEEIVGQIVESYQEHVADDVSQVSGIGDMSVNWTPLTSRPDDLATELVKAWLTTPSLSPIVLSGAIDIPAILDAVGVPVTNDGEARILKTIDAMRDASEASRENMLSMAEQRQGVNVSTDEQPDQVDEKDDPELAAFLLGQRG